MIKMSGLEEYADRFRNADRIIMTACGTSWHSALVAEYLFEEFARIRLRLNTDQSSDTATLLFARTRVIAISQSGETADTLAAIKMAKEAGAMVLVFVMYLVQPLPRNSRRSIYPRRT